MACPFARAEAVYILALMTLSLWDVVSQQPIFPVYRADGALFIDWYTAQSTRRTPGAL